MTNISKNTLIISANATAPVHQQEPAKKYEFIDDYEYVDSHFLMRIRALRDFDDVKAGDLGGFIEKESNLSHKGNCWVYDNAKIKGFFVDVYGDARIYGNAIFQGMAINDYCEVYGNAHVYGYVYGNAHVSGGSRILADAHVYDNAHLSYETITKDNLFYYVYGLLHSEDYRARYAHN